MRKVSRIADNTIACLVKMGGFISAFTYKKVMALIPMLKISTAVQARQRNYTSLRAVFRSENGAIDLASIMVGIIVIGLIGGVIAATVFAVIPWAQDNAAKQQLDSIHSAENASYGLSADPTVTPDQSKRNMFTDSQGLMDGKLLATSTTYCVVLTSAGKDYTAYAKSASGKIWTATNSAKKAAVLQGTPAGACAVLDTSTGGTVTTPPLVTNGGVVTTYSAANWSGTQELAVTADQTVYATMDTHTIRKMAAGGAVTTLAGNGIAGFADGQGSTAKFNTPQGLALGPDGNLYVADYGNHRIRMVTPAGAVTTVLGTGVQSSTDGDKSTATIASPYAIAFDSAGNLYISELLGKAVRKMTAAGVVTTLAILPDYVRALDVDAAGNIYASNNSNYVITKVTSAGVMSTFATSTSYYLGIAVEQSTGIVYAANLGNHTVEKILPDGTKTVLAGDSGLSGNVNGTGADARFTNPHSITIDSTGGLIVSSVGTADTTLRMIK